MKKEKLYEGKAKILYSSDDPKEIIQYFKDDATAFNNLKKDFIKGKGVLNNLISEHIMLKIIQEGIPSHFLKRISNREQLIKKLTIIPLEVIIRNVAAGSMAKRLGIKDGTILSTPVFEICYKNDTLADPIINDDHAVKVLKLLTEEELRSVRVYSFKINQILQQIFSKIKIKLVDFKIEFGFDDERNIILADEISPDSCRLWDEVTGERMDKDRFRMDLGGFIEAYLEVAKRLGIKIDEKEIK